MTSEIPIPTPRRKREEYNKIMPVFIYGRNNDYLCKVIDSTPKEVENKLIDEGFNPVRITSMNDHECNIKFFGKGN